jgi:hypothetical protein
MLPVWMASLLTGLWKESAPIAIAGGFPAYCMGYTSSYEDIDIFMPKHIFASFVSR